MSVNSNNLSVTLDKNDLLDLLYMCNGKIPVPKVLPQQRAEPTVQKKTLVVKDKPKKVKSKISHSALSQLPISKWDDDFDLTSDLDSLDQNIIDMLLYPDFQFKIINPEFKNILFDIRNGKTITPKLLRQKSKTYSVLLSRLKKGRYVYYDNSTQAVLLERGEQMLEDIGNGRTTCIDYHKHDIPNKKFIKQLKCIMNLKTRICMYISFMLINYYNKNGRFCNYNDIYLLLQRKTSTMVPPYIYNSEMFHIEVTGNILIKKKGLDYLEILREKNISKIM